MYGLSTHSHSAQSYRCFNKNSVLDLYIRQKRNFLENTVKNFIKLKPKKGNLLVKIEKNPEMARKIVKKRNFLENTEKNGNGHFGKTEFAL